MTAIQIMTPHTDEALPWALVCFPASRFARIEPLGMLVVARASAPADADRRPQAFANPADPLGLGYYEFGTYHAGRYSGVSVLPVGDHWTNPWPEDILARFRAATIGK